MKQKTQDELLTQEAIEAQYERLTLKDDFMFGKIMQDERNCIEMLKRLTGNKIENVKSVVKQKVVQITNDSKGVRYDVYIEDDNNNAYDAEMQQESSESNVRTLPRRARFYQGLMDLNLLESGGQYKNLKNSYVIFICTFDPFGKGLSCYDFQNICTYDADICLGDGRKILFFNTKGTIINVSKEALKFLSYIETTEACDEYTEQLNIDVAKARMNKEWRVEYMKSLLHDMDVRDAGREEGREEGKVEGKVEAILDILGEHGDISEELENCITSETDMERLKGWVKLSARVSSIEEFQEKMYGENHGKFNVITKRED